MRTGGVLRMAGYLPAWGLALVASAEIVVYEGFDSSPDSSLEGAGHPGFAWGTNAWFKSIGVSDWIVASNSLAHPSIPATGHRVVETNLTYGADYRRRFNPLVLGDGQCIWFSCLVNITQGASWELRFTSSGLNDSQFGVGGSYVNYRMAAKIGTGAGSGSGDSLDLGQNVPRLIVGRYRYAAADVEQLDVWIDPDVGVEPEPGGAGSSNHLVFARQLAIEPDRRDCVHLNDRSLGSLEFDELRVGTTWQDVISRCVDKVTVADTVVAGDSIVLSLGQLTPGATTVVERCTAMAGGGIWTEVAAFVPQGRSTNWISAPPEEMAVYYRVGAR